MAEFCEVMKQWRRFCKSHRHCGECEFDGKGICGDGHLSDVPANDIELRIMAWAAEHPVVYPTWADYISMLVLKDICTRKISGPDTVLTYAMKTHIPADIAEKLGVEPKEDV